MRITNNYLPMLDGDPEVKRLREECAEQGLPLREHPSRCFRVQGRTVVDYKTADNTAYSAEFGTLQDATLTEIIKLALN